MNLQHERIARLCDALSLPFVAQGYGAAMSIADRDGISVFYKDESGTVFHTYSCYARGIDMVNSTYQFLDLVPKGRDENPEAPQDWVRYHDKYEN